MATPTALNMNGVNIQIHKDNPKQLAMLRKLLFVSGVIMFAGIILCNLQCQGKIHIPPVIKMNVIAPMTGASTSVFTTTLIGYSIIQSS